MGQPAFTIIEDDCREPLVARAYARKTSLGRRSLAEALAARKDVGGPKDVVVEAPDEKTLAQCYTFPDDAVLLMIGSTQELEDACKEAIAAGILALVTATHRSCSCTTRASRYIGFPARWTRSSPSAGCTIRCCRRGPRKTPGSSTRAGRTPRAFTASQPMSLPPTTGVSRARFPRSSDG
jgi:hypothetical protein